MPCGSPSVRVFLCDDTDAFRALLRYSLSDDPLIEVVGEAADGQAGVQGVAQTHPDVVLMDGAMPGLDGLEASRMIRRATPSARIVGLSAFTADRLADRFAQAGAHAYLEKGADLAEITRTVHRVAALAA